MNIHFEATGYDSSDFQVNAGPTLLFIFLAPFYCLLTYVLSRLCKKQKCKNWAQAKINGTYFNGMISFMDAQMLMLSTAANINIYKVGQGKAAEKSSFYMACLFQAFCLI